MRIRRILTLTGAMILMVIVVALDLVRSSVDFQLSGLIVARDLMVIGSFSLLYFFLELSDPSKTENVVRRMGLILIAGVVVTLMMSAVSLLGDQGSFEAKEGKLLPLGFKAVFLASFVTFGFALLCILLFRFLRDLVLYKRRRGTRRNLIIQMVLMAATGVSTIGLDPLDTSVLTSVLFGLTCAMIVVNAFRLSWIVYLSKRGKIFTLVYGFFLFSVLTVLNALSHSGLVNQLLLYYSHPVRELVGLTLLFGNVYYGMAFVSTLFHLPTADAFERKATEITSLHDLGKLITRVFDFHELIDTVTAMTLQVCEARECWLEIVHRQRDLTKGTADANLHASFTEGYWIQVMGMKNIGADEIEQLFPFGRQTIRDLLIQERKALVVDDVATDRRIRVSQENRTRTGSMVVVPLISHTELIGILYATKETEYGFFKDDVEMISAFADHATMAIENSRLIDKSLERERLVKEMSLAQEMQKRLLPQRLPQLPGIQIDATSTPAFEVGGDYYDVVHLKGNELGIVVGDVSGKGMSAAFYMSEVKGIFQSLSRIYSSPREFLLNANEVLSGSIDRRSFISLIYAVIHLQTGRLIISRAGHCPMLLVRENEIGYIRPSGMGLGLSEGSTFAGAIEEFSLQLDPGDVCVFYTDGLTEARNGNDEFGYERLVECLSGMRNKDTVVIKNSILESVRSFTSGQPLHDDLTLVVLKWCGPGG